ncbi:hypothetical protein KKA14_10410 [bacterium]|nr:hypothetical protein [bacterium]
MVKHQKKEPAVKLKITGKDLELFHKDLWKDSRRLEIAVVNGNKTIRKYSDNGTSLNDEYKFISRLKKIASFKIPEIVSHPEKYIEFQYVAGTRAFNLIMDLKALFNQEADKCYLELGIELFQLLNDDLREFQSLMVNNDFCGGIGIKYPVVEKVNNVFCLLSSVLSIEFPFDELAKIIKLYDKHSKIPFRDASTKNVVLDIPVLYLKKASSHKERLSFVRNLVKSGELKDYFRKEKIFHIDFSGCMFLCPEADDWIALRYHEATNWLSQCLDFEAKSTTDDLDLCTKFVRFSRFGGRKLAYKLLNNNGYQIRFSLDNESYYFIEMKKICDDLMRHGLLSGNALSEAIFSLENACGITPKKDYFHEFLGKDARYGYYRDVYPN